MMYTECDTPAATRSMLAVRDLTPSETDSVAGAWTYGEAYNVAQWIHIHGLPYEGVVGLTDVLNALPFNLQLWSISFGLLDLDWENRFCVITGDYVPGVAGGEFVAIMDLAY